MIRYVHIVGIRELFSNHGWCIRANLQQQSRKIKQMEFELRAAG